MSDSCNTDDMPLDLRQAAIVTLLSASALRGPTETAERRFLLSLVACRPEWPLLGITHAGHLPGIRWKLHNLAQLEHKSPEKFAEQAEVLSQRLG